ncbi:MBL fold metallo-hydrolase [Candidatus Uhrbacteria bacterium]|nr:MBL fold metallo-hydrolase [Candidatus Uhrbacteria bacterium]
MQISWLGLSAFEMTTKNASGEVVLVTDPYDGQTGLRLPRTLEAQMTLVSHDEPDANNVSAITGSPHIIDIPGEFEIRGVFVFGIGATLKRGILNIIYRIETEGMHLAHLGALDRELTDEELKRLSNIDILMVPVGGAGVLSPSSAAEVIAQVEPRVVIPMTHHLPSLKTRYETVDAFCKQMGVCRKEDMNKYKVTRKDLPEEDMLIVNLTH